MNWRTILVAEDDAPVASMLVELLDDLGYSVAICSSVEQTLQAAAAIRPRLVLVGLDGFGDFKPGWCAARSLADVRPSSRLLMLATSEIAVAEVGRTARGQLFTAALLKPFLLDDFTALIERMYETRGADLPMPGWCYADTRVLCE
jgi:CheY-like chemotaxis protein